MSAPAGRPRRRVRILTLLGLVLFGARAMLDAPASAQAQARPIDARSLLGLSGPELDAVYRQGTVAAIPPGRVRGTAILAPGARRNGIMAAGTRLVWQGKDFPPTGATAVNRFFGLPMIRAQVYQGPSWLDGAPALVLDYSRTSRVYARNRDEIRQVAPGVLLGLMYARTTPAPTLRMYFVLEAQP